MIKKGALRNNQPINKEKVDQNIKDKERIFLNLLMN
jgi:hypothetical protein